MFQLLSMFSIVEQHNRSDNKSHFCHTQDDRLRVHFKVLSPHVFRIRLLEMEGLIPNKSQFAETIDSLVHTAVMTSVLIASVKSSLFVLELLELLVARHKLVFVCNIQKVVICPFLHSSSMSRRTQLVLLHDPQRSYCADGEPPECV
jgi:hypothetical protein